MERSCLAVSKKSIRNIIQPLALASLLMGVEVCFTLKPAFGAGIILSRPDVVEIQDSKENFPESRFGSPPSRLGVDGKSRFVANAVEDMRQTEAGGSPNSGEGLVSNRKPAGLEFTQE